MGAGGKGAVTSARLEAWTKAGSPRERGRERDGLIPAGEAERAPEPLGVWLLSPLQRPVLLQTAALLGVLVLGFGYFWLLVPKPEARLQQLGLFCSTFTISMYLSPLADLVSGGCPGKWGT